jgi:hypothetical protein
MKSLLTILLNNYNYPSWFIEMEGYMPEPNDYSEGRLDEQKALREA